MKQITRLNVISNGIKVGDLAVDARNRIGFQYSAQWLKDGYSLSPMQLPFDAAIHICDSSLFHGLYGVFADSLPDGWGLSLMDRFFKKQGLDRSRITPLDRLAYIGTRAMGALEYQPEIQQNKPLTADIFALSESARRLIRGETEEVLDELMITGGSPGGARPKVTVAFSDDFQQCLSGTDTIPDGYSHWLVKFHAVNDTPHYGVIEKIYADMARLSGLDMPETTLINAGDNRFFAVRRFDREGSHH